MTAARNFSVLRLNINHEVSLRIKYSQERILKIWEEDVRSQLPIGRQEDPLVLLDSIPEFFVELEQTFFTPETEKQTKVLRLVARGHAEEKLKVYNFRLDQVLLEFHLLRKTIFEVLDEVGLLTPLVRETILDFVHNKMTSAGLVILEAHTSQAQSELRQVGQALRELKEEHSQFLSLSKMDLNLLREEREIRDRFVATLTHDLRTPLTTMRMSAELIQRRPRSLAYSNQNLIKNIIDAVDRTDQMIRDLLDANSIRAGQKLPIKLVACDLRQVIINTIEVLSVVHGQRFIVHADTAVHGHWSCEGLRRAIENLIGNAIKYGDPNAPVTIGLFERHERVRITVHNWGHPLTPEEQAIIFQPFRRTLSAQVGNQKGWGLGLILVRGIAESHGGIASVESSPIQGTTFTIEIPKDARSFQPDQEGLAT
ncbi:MAG: HAMP domain-containing sensor histidine kinase [Bdellovibrionia bacterium]